MRLAFEDHCGVLPEDEILFMKHRIDWMLVIYRDPKLMAVYPSVGSGGRSVRRSL
jgi:hypothetical protein